MTDEPIILPCPCTCDCGEVTDYGDLCIACEHGQHVDDETEPT